jgi:hypothetical protein
MPGALDRRLEGVRKSPPTGRFVQIHPGVRIVWQPGQDQTLETRNKAQRFQRIVKFPGLQPWAVDQFRVQRIDLLGSRKRRLCITGHPQCNVIAVGIKVLRGMRQSSESLPGRNRIGVPQRRDDHIPLRFNVCARFVEGIVVEMKFVMADLPAQSILTEIGGNDDL